MASPWRSMIVAYHKVLISEKNDGKSCCIPWTPFPSLIMAFTNECLLLTRPSADV